MRDYTEAAARLEGYREVHHVVSGPGLNLAECINWYCC